MKSTLKSVSRRPDGSESWVVSGHGLDLSRQRELYLGIVELLDAGTTALVGGNLLHFDDLEVGARRNEQLQ